MGFPRPLVVIAALLFAGCTSGPDGDAGAASAGTSDAAIEPAVIPETPGASEVLPVVGAGEAPVWRLGDAWAITTRSPDSEERSVLVVTSVASDHYILETTSEEMAGFDAMFDVSYLGKIRASDLAGSQQGSPVLYFSFPLSDGKTWTTTWDGYEVALAAKASARGFDILGTVDGEPYVEYDYVPELRWWSKLDFVRDGYGIRVDRAQTGWSGELAVATAQLVYEGAPAAPVASPNTAAFTISEGQAYGIVSFRGGGSQYASTFVLTDPSGMPHLTESISTFEVELMGPRMLFAQERIPATPGEWHLVGPSVHDPTGGFWVTVHEVAIAKKAFA